jgi:hypothetical protein
MTTTFAWNWGSFIVGVALTLLVHWLRQEVRLSVAG